MKSLSAQSVQQAGRIALVLPGLTAGTSAHLKCENQQTLWQYQASFQLKNSLLVHYHSFFINTLPERPCALIKRNCYSRHQTQKRRTQENKRTHSLERQKQTNTPLEIWTENSSVEVRDLHTSIYQSNNSICVCVTVHKRINTLNLLNHFYFI